MPIDPYGTGGGPGGRDVWYREPEPIPRETVPPPPTPSGTPDPGAGITINIGGDDRRRRDRGGEETIAAPAPLAPIGGWTSAPSFDIPGYGGDFMQYGPPRPYLPMQTRERSIEAPWAPTSEQIEESERRRRQRSAYAPPLQMREYEGRGLAGWRPPQRGGSTMTTEQLIALDAAPSEAYKDWITSWGQAGTGVPIAPLPGGADGGAPGRWGGGGGGRGGGGGDGDEADAAPTPPEGTPVDWHPVYQPMNENGETVATFYPDDYYALPEWMRPYLAQIMEHFGWMPTLFGQFGPYQFRRDDPFRMWVTEADLAWIPNPQARQWLIAFFGSKGWGEPHPWPPTIEETEPVVPPIH